MAESDNAWIIDITYINKPCESWLYLAVAVGVFFCKVIGCTVNNEAGNRYQSDISGCMD